MSYQNKHCLISLLILCNIMLCCNKDQHQTTTTASSTNTNPHNVGCRFILNNPDGLVAMGDTVKFVGGYIPFSSFDSCLWNFGDGLTELDTTSLPNLGSLCSLYPYHIYTHTGTYTATMCVDDTTTVIAQNNYPLQGAEDNHYNADKIIVIADPLYTYHICQPRLWHGGIENITTIDGVETTYNLPDTTFSIKYLDKLDFILWNVKFVYNTNSTANYQSYIGTVLPPSEILINSSLYYNIPTDSINFDVHYFTLTGPANEQTNYEVSFHSP